MKYALDEFCKKIDAQCNNHDTGQFETDSAFKESLFDTGRYLIAKQVDHERNHTKHCQVSGINPKGLHISRIKFTRKKPHAHWDNKKKKQSNKKYIPVSTEDFFALRFLFHVSIYIIVLLPTAACSTLQKPKNKIAVLTTAGAIAGASGGALLSPNKESQGLNALVFGLSGALTGGLIGILTSPTEPDKSTHDLKKKELSSAPGTKEFSIAPTQTLPDFVKARVQPVIIEEYLEQDRVTEEGTLHEPHKAYRIKRPAELYANPVKEAKQ